MLKLWCGIIAIAVFKLPLYSASCSYGHAPGHWVELEGRIVWQLFDPQCQLDRLVNTWAMGQLDRPISMLLIGDSTDRLLHEHLCQEEIRREQADPQRGSYVLHRSGPNHGWDPHSVSPWFNCTFCTTCVLGSAKDVPEGTDPLFNLAWRRLTIAHRYVWGVAPSGPYWMGYEGGVHEKTDEAIAYFKNFTGGDPDVVVFASVYWDLGRIRLLDPNTLTEDTFPPSVLQEWQANLASVLRHLKSALPNSVRIFRTQSHPLPKDCGSGEDMDANMGKKAHVVQLNAAGRYVASEHHWHVVDVEQMIATFAHPKNYLHDHMHQQDFLSLEIMNVYLNIAASKEIPLE